MTAPVNPGQATAHAARIAEMIAPAIAVEIAAAAAISAHKTRDTTVMSACRQVGDAVDRLDQARFTAREIPARRALERAARNLRKAMDRSKRHGR